MFRSAFVDYNLTFGYVNDIGYIQKTLDTSMVGLSLARVLSELMTFKVKMVFHSLMFEKYCTEKKPGGFAPS